MKSIPQKGVAHDQIMSAMRALRKDDARWREGKTFSLVYFAGDEVSALQKAAYTEMMAENGLSPMAFPSLQRMENEVVAMTTSLFHGDNECAGAMTSGGTESIMLACLAARENAKKRGVATPTIIAPLSAHPAFDKACHYLSIPLLHAPLGPDFAVDVGAVEKMIDGSTAMIVGSAPAYPHGVVDPIGRLGALAKKHGLLLHVDACLGGFILPFAKRLGREIPPFDFSVPGVTSLSADLHKYGYAAKGASVLLHKTAELRQHQFYTYGGWPGGLYASPSMMGTRPGGAIAAAWAALQFLGIDGYVERARTLLAAADRMINGVRDAGLRVYGDPAASVFSFGSESLNIFELGDAMDARGWKLDRQSNPAALHCMITPAHAPIADAFIADLKACAAALARGEPAPEGSAALYGMTGAMVESGQIDGFLHSFLDGLFNTAGIE